MRICLIFQWIGIVNEFILYLTLKFYVVTIKQINE